MREKFVRSSEMDAASHVEEATDWAKIACRRESRCPGDYGDAMRRVASKTRVPFSVLKRLHYDPPKDISARYFEALAFYVSEQNKRYREQPKVEAKTKFGRFLLGMADAFDRGADTLGREENGDLSDV